MDWPVPKNAKEILRFQGFMNFYGRFIRNYADIMTPITRLLKKGTKFEWGKDQQESFERIKQAFTSATIVQHPDLDQPFWVETDASDFAIGAVLSQKNEQGKLHPIAFYSRQLLPAERNYEIYDRELLAVHQAFMEWRYCLQGSQHPVTVLCDHKNLEYFMTTRNLTRRQARWSLFFN